MIERAHCIRRGTALTTCPQNVPKGRGRLTRDTSKMQDHGSRALAMPCTCGRRGSTRRCLARFETRRRPAAIKYNAYFSERAIDAAQARFSSKAGPHASPAHGKCQRILVLVEEAGDEIWGNRSAPSGTVRISCTAAFGVLHASRILFEFQDRHPDIGIDLGLTNERVDLVREGVDVALRLGRLDESASPSRRILPPAAARRSIRGWTSCRVGTLFARAKAPGRDNPVRCMSASRRSWRQVPQTKPFI